VRTLVTALVAGIGLVAGAAAADDFYVGGRVTREIEVNRPRSIFQCDTPLGKDWYGSTERCLAELCVGGNYTNRYISDAERLRRNPCYGRDPYELQR
jgi:hypothetical protein